jgi:two-component system cell cycle sensor histidine kinase/response regulator CckA
VESDRSADESSVVVISDIDASEFDESPKPEAVGQLTGAIAHEFNNLLLIIRGYSEILLADPATRDLIGVKEIGKAAEDGAVLTRRLLDFSHQQQPPPS